MAGTFPTLKSGNTVFNPLQDTQSFGTGVLRFMDNSEQRWRARLMLRRFKLAFTNINAYDAALVLQFFRSQFGRYDCTWSLPIAGVTYANMAFDTDAFQVTENKRNQFSMSFDVIQVKSDVPTIPAATVYFPQINATGVMTALPYTSSLNYRTTLVDMESGKRYTYQWQAVPLGKWAVNLPALTDAELVVAQDFFYSMEGRKGEFKFMDPGGNLILYSDDYGNAAWTKTDITVGSAQTDPKGGVLARRMTSSGSNGLLVATVIPDGGASGFVICASIWARAASFGQQLSIGFIDSGFSVLGSTTWDLPAGQWIRIHHSMTLATSSYIRVLIGGFATWGSGRVIDLFSGQCSPTPGPGPRLLTPGMDGLRAKCRFDTDDFAVNHIGPNEHSVTLPIVEYI
jgi:hypothetical protein